MYFLYISGLKLIHVSKEGPWSIFGVQISDVKCEESNRRVLATLAMALIILNIQMLDDLLSWEGVHTDSKQYVTSRCSSTSDVLY